MKMSVYTSMLIGWVANEEESKLANTTTYTFRYTRMRKRLVYALKNYEHKRVNEMDAKDILETFSNLITCSNDNVSHVIEAQLPSFSAQCFRARCRPTHRKCSAMSTQRQRSFSLCVAAILCLSRLKAGPRFSQFLVSRKVCLCSYVLFQSSLSSTIQTHVHIDTSMCIHVRPLPYL